MKEDMMIVGLRAVDEDMMEIEFVSLVVARKKVDIVERIQAGDFVAASKEVANAQRQYRSKIYKPRVWCSEHNILLFQSITLEIEPADKNRIAETYKK